MDPALIDSSPNHADEAFLECLNAQLERAEIEHYSDLAEEYPTIHVLGVPRSGTTLALQLLAAHTDVGYIDHVAAAFWRAPVAGLRLSENLRRHLPRESTYRSDFGRTRTLTEPHEFSRLWARLLGTEFGVESLAQPASSDGVDWVFFKRVVTNMCDAVQHPIAFKSFHAIWHLPVLCQTLPKAILVVVKRDPLAVAQSLVSMRERLYGSREVWASAKPREYAWLKDTDYATQIAGQIHYINRAIEAGLRTVGSGAAIEVSYESLCRDPGTFLEMVTERVSAHGSSLRTFEVQHRFSLSEGNQDKATRQALRAALQRFDERRDENATTADS
jgi:hypothetical protein